MMKTPMETETKREGAAMRTLENRVALWNGTVHYANASGRPECGSAKRTHPNWIVPTTDDVTCAKCIKAHGHDINPR